MGWRSRSAKSEPVVREQPRVQPLQLRQRIQHLRDDRERRGGRHRPHGHIGKCGEKVPDRRQPQQRHGKVRGNQQQPQHGLGCPDPIPGERRGRPHGEQRRADSGPHQRHRHRRRDGEGRRPGVFHEQQPDPARGRNQQVPQGSQPCLAGDGIPCHHPHGQRQEQRDGDQHGGHANEQAVLRNPVQERRSPAGRNRGGQPHGHGDQDRNGRQGAQHGPGPAAAEEHARARTRADRGPCPRAGGAARTAGSAGPSRGGTAGGVSWDRILYWTTSKPSPVSATKRSSRLTCSVAKPRTRTPAATRAATTASGATAPLPSAAGSGA